MRKILRATPQAFKQARRDRHMHGRLPLAWLTFGYLEGHGWAFLAPWAQEALFPGKGRLQAVGSPYRQHDWFFLLRVRSRVEEVQHPACSWPIAGRYWYGFAWREAWGYRRILGPLKLPCVRWVRLDPDRIDRDPGKAEDWGTRPGEDW